MVPGGQQGQGVAPDRVERHVTEVQHAGLADDHVEPDGQQDEDADVLGEHVRPRALGRHDLADRVARQHDGEHDIEDDDRQGLGPPGLRLPDAARAAGSQPVLDPAHALPGRQVAQARSYPGPLQRLAEQAGRPEQQDQHQDDEHRRVAPLRTEDAGPVELQQPDDQAARAGRRAGCRCRRGRPP